MHVATYVCVSNTWVWEDQIKFHIVHRVCKSDICNTVLYGMQVIS